MNQWSPMRSGSSPISRSAPEQAGPRWRSVISEKLSRHSSRPIHFISPSRECAPGMAQPPQRPVQVGSLHCWDSELPSTAGALQGSHRVCDLMLSTAPFAPQVQSKEHGPGSSQQRRDVKAAREAWFEGQLDLDPTKLVFIDETGATTKMARLRGRAPRGQRCKAAIPHGHWKTTTFTAGLRAT